MIAGDAGPKRMVPPTGAHPLRVQAARIVPVKTVRVLSMHFAVRIPGTKHAWASAMTVVVDAEEMPAECLPMDARSPLSLDVRDAHVKTACAHKTHFAAIIPGIHPASASAKPIVEAAPMEAAMDVHQVTSLGVTGVRVKRASATKTHSAATMHGMKSA